MDSDSDPLTHEIIGAAIAVSKFWGNGVLESVYKKSLAIKLRKAMLDVEVTVVIVFICAS